LIAFVDMKLYIVVDSYFADKLPKEEKSQLRDDQPNVKTRHSQLRD
jgi:hypothetical protein